MNISKFLSPYIKARDVEKRGPLTVTITAIKEEELGRGDDAEDKLVFYFQELDQGWIPNKTNLQVVAELFDSDDTDDYIGKQLTLIHDPSVRYGGKRVGGIKVREASKKKGKK